MTDSIYEHARKVARASMPRSDWAAYGVGAALIAAGVALGAVLVGQGHWSRPTARQQLIPVSRPLAGPEAVLSPVPLHGPDAKAAPDVAPAPIPLPIKRPEISKPKPEPKIVHKKRKKRRAVRATT